MKKGMHLLVSATTLEEARCCVRSGVDIIDVKNPLEGSLGGHAPRMIGAIRKVIPVRRVFSATIGDCPNKPGLVAQAAAGLAAYGVEYIKLGLCDAFTVSQAVELVSEAVWAVKKLRPKARVVVCGYADAKLHKLIHPHDIPEVVAKARADVAMVDTLSKGNGKRLFDYFPENDVRAFSRHTRRFGAQVALAGSLDMEDVTRISREGYCDIVGVRSLACRAGNRRSTLSLERIRAITAAIARTRCGS